MNRLYWIVTFCSLFALAGCTKPPYQNLDAAEYMLARARVLEAPQYAPTEFQAAYDALQDAHTSMDKLDYSSASNSLDFALQHARRAVNLTLETKAAEVAAEEARRKAEAELLAAEEAAHLATQQTRKEVEAKPKKVKPKPEPKPKPPVPATTIEVGSEDTLWTLSANPAVYGDGLLWPLLYQANRDQIKDPRQIYPGQMLNIRRDLTEQEMEDARQKAQESDIFPLPQP